MGLLQRADVIIGAVLVVAVVASIVGVATYDEEGRFGLFAVTWVERSRSESFDEGHNGAGPVDLSFAVTERNLTRIDTVVRVQAAGPRVQGYTVQVEVEGPGFSERAQESVAPGVSQAIEIEVTVDVRDAPTVEQLHARNPDAAVHDLDAAHGSAAGQGTWTITITFGGGPIPENHGIAADVDIVSYEATVAVTTPDVPPG